MGQYSVVGCEPTTGADPFFCSDIFYFGRSLLLDLDLDLQQSNGRVSGVATQGGIEGRVEGTVDMAGLLTLSGQLGVGATATTTIEDWQTQLVDDSLDGSWLFLVEDNTGSGFAPARVDADLTLVGPSVPTFSNCPMEQTISQDQLILGALEAGDCQLEEDASYFDVYAMDVSTGDQVRISISSSNFTPALFVVDVDERLLAFEGNQADTLQAVALEAVVAETWLIVANSFLGEQSGGYTLLSEALSGAGVASLALEKVAPPGRRLLREGGDGARASRSHSARASLIDVFTRRRGSVVYVKSKRE